MAYPFITDESTPLSGPFVAPVGRVVPDGENPLGYTRDTYLNEHRDALLGLREKCSGWVSVKSHGASPDGSESDNATAIADARAAAISKGVPLVFPERGTYLTTDPIVLWDGAIISGAGRGQTIIRNTSSDVFTCGSDSVISDAVLRDFQAIANVGHVLNMSGGKVLALTSIHDVIWGTATANKACLYAANGDLTDVRIYSSEFGYPSASTTVGAIYNTATSDGGSNDVSFRDIRFTMSGLSPGFYAIYSECDIAGCNNLQWTFDGINFELTHGGAMKLLGHRKFAIRDVAVWDLLAPVTAIMFDIGTSSTQTRGSAHGELKRIRSLEGSALLPDIRISGTATGNIELGALDATYVDGGGDRTLIITDSSGISAGTKTFQNIGPSVTWIEDGRIKRAPGVPVTVLNTTATVSTSATSEAVLETATIPQGSMQAGSSVRVRASGTTSGAANTKTVNLRFGNTTLTGTVLGTVVNVAGNNDQWMIEAEIAFTAQDVQQFNATSWKASTATVTSPGTLTVATSNAAARVEVTGLLGNASDSVTVRTVQVQAIR